MGRGLHYSSGRVIGVGRLLLATLYLLAIVLDASQPARAPVAAYAMLAAYLAFAAVTLALTWNDWWLEARIAGAAHAIDILFFTLLVTMTAGYTSPYFTFFMFVLLSAAIRWGWRATALTATLLILLYLLAGYLVATASGDVELQHFAVRTGHLLILSLILIWFGATHWRPQFPGRSASQAEAPSLSASPLQTGLAAAMSGIGASSGAFVWRDGGDREFRGLALRGEQRSDFAVPARAFAPDPAASAFLYDFRSNRSLKKDSGRNPLSFATSDVIAPELAAQLGLAQGLAIPVHAGEGEGMMFLEGILGLSTDHVDLGEQLSEQTAAHVQGHALLTAAEEKAEARSRLTLARDLHDGVVQFLAGAAFRLEAMKRAVGSGRNLAPDLDELKQLILQEQRELRTFITALRSGPLVAFNDLAGDLESLAERLCRQWDIRCEFTARGGEMMIPARLHLDSQHLMREAVANAVRHAEAQSVSIALAAQSDVLKLEVVNDGRAYPKRGSRPELPTSLKERVEEAGGSLDVARGMGITRLSISLPIEAKRQ